MGQIPNWHFKFRLCKGSRRFWRAVFWNENLSIFSRAVALLFNWKYFWGWNLVRTTCRQRADDVRMTCGWCVDDMWMTQEISLVDDICHLHVCPHVIRTSSAWDGNSSAWSLLASLLVKSYQTSKKNTAWNPQKENEVENDCVNHYYYFCRLARK